jgi:hypothetical protein
MFVLSESEEVLDKPIKPYKPSQCTPLFFNAYKMRGVSRCDLIANENDLLVFTADVAIVHLSAHDNLSRYALTDLFTRLLPASTRIRNTQLW